MFMKAMWKLMTRVQMILKLHHPQDLLKKSEEWLQGPDGGRKEELVVHQCSCHIEIVVEYIDKENRDLTNILHKQTPKREMAY
jgi:hypothetical protein